MPTWLKTVLRAIGLIAEAAPALAQTAAAVAPALGASAKTQADIEKAATAAQAAQGLGKIASEAAKD